MARPGKFRPSKSARWWLTRLLLLLASLAASLGVVELGLRAYPWLYMRYRAEPLELPSQGAALVYVMGDSVPAGLRIDAADAWPTWLGRLLAERPGPQVQVYNAAQPGASLFALLKDQTSALYQVQPGTPLIAILQVGHNDLFSMVNEGMAVTAGDAEMNSLWTELRLLRVFHSWAERKRRWSAPDKVSEEAQARFARDVKRVCGPVQERGGRCLLATYPVCGMVGRERTEYYARGHNRIRNAQLTVNQLLRATAKTDDLKLLDFEEQVSLPVVWSEDYCADAVHPSAAIHHKMAEVALAQLFPS